MDKSVIITAVVNQMRADIINGDLTAIEKLVGDLPEDKLIEFLPSD